MLNMVCKFKYGYSRPHKDARFYLYSFDHDGEERYFKSFASKSYALKCLDKYVGDMEDRINDLFVQHGKFKDRPRKSFDGRRFRLYCSHPFCEEPYYSEDYEWKRG